MCALESDRLADTLGSNAGSFAAVATVRIGDFEWDDDKAAANLAKHGISFPEAMTVFLDELAVPLQDVANPERLRLIGESRLGRLLLVVFTELRADGTIRIISARRATKRERRAYEAED